MDDIFKSINGDISFNHCSDELRLNVTDQLNLAKTQDVNRQNEQLNRSNRQDEPPPFKKHKIFDQQSAYNQTLDNEPSNQPNVNNSFINQQHTSNQTMSNQQVANQMFNQQMPNPHLNGLLQQSNYSTTTHRQPYFDHQHFVQPAHQRSYSTISPQLLNLLPAEWRPFNQMHHMNLNGQMFGNTVSNRPVQVYYKQVPVSNFLNSSLGNCVTSTMTNSLPNLIIEPLSIENLCRDSPRDSLNNSLHSNSTNTHPQSNDSGFNCSSGIVKSDEFDHSNLSAEQLILNEPHSSSTPSDSNLAHSSSRPINVNNDCPNNDRNQDQINLKANQQTNNPADRSVLNHVQIVKADANNNSITHQPQVDRNQTAKSNSKRKSQIIPIDSPKMSSNDSTCDTSELDEAGHRIDLTGIKEIDDDGEYAKKRIIIPIYKFRFSIDVNEKPNARLKEKLVDEIVDFVMKFIPIFRKTRKNVDDLLGYVIGRYKHMVEENKSGYVKFNSIVSYR